MGGGNMVLLGAALVAVMVQISVLIGTYMTWRSKDHACFVNEMRKARREKRRIIGWNSAGAPILDTPGTALFVKEI